MTNNNHLLNFFKDGDFLPVIAPIGLGDDGKSYNINADLVAGKVAEAVNAEKLILMTNTEGVLDGAGSLISIANRQMIEDLIRGGVNRSEPINEELMSSQGGAV